MNLIPETGEYYSPSSNQSIFYGKRVEGMPVVKTTGNWFYNHETDRFISKHKFMLALETAEQITNVKPTN